METRILIPTQLKIVVKSSTVVCKSENRGQNLIKKKKIRLNYTKVKNLLEKSSDKETGKEIDIKQKPTSSSGCDAESDTDLDSNDSETTEAEEDLDGEFRESSDEDKNEKDKKYNYNLRRHTHTTSETGQLKNNGEKVKSEDSKESGLKKEAQNSPFVTIANADSINQIEIEKRDDVGEIKICAGRRIDKGSIFSPNEGQVSILFLNNLPPIRADDMRFVFGCFDRTVDDEDEDGDKGSESENEDYNKKQIRLCNWVRFVKQCPSMDDMTHDTKVNVRAKFVDRKAVFEFTQTVMQGTEILVYFDIDSLTQNVKEEIHSSRQMKGINPNQIAPLDLSKSESEIKLRKSDLRKSTSQHDQSDNDHSRSPSPSPLPTPPRASQQFFPFSINSVLQPVKLFQPYNHRSDVSSNSKRENNLQYPTITMQQPVAAIPNSMRNSGVHMITHLRNTTSVPNLRPILRTRGRERSLLPCEVCGKAFDRPSLLKRHMRTHTGEKPHICDVCSKGFSTSSSLNTHRRIHSGEKPHQCPVCGKRFTASSNLYYHRMTHNKEKPHKCLCGKSFPTPGDLKSHQYVHSGSWPYNCPVCHRGFSKQTNLRNHLLLHSGDKPHNCQACGKKFALACNLRAHLRTHEEEPMSSCLSCKRTFLSSLNMLDNGQCRSCIIHQQQQQQQNSPSISINSTSSNSSNSLNRIFSVPTSGSGTGSASGQSLPNSSTIAGNTDKSENMSLSALSKIAGGGSSTIGGGGGFQNSVAAAAALSMSLESDNLLSSAMSNPTAGFHFPNSNFNLALPSPYHLSESLLGPRPNPFLEQLFQWNWRFAKETAGNLGLMQQKLIESQMLAAQLMSVSSNGSSDILKFRL